ncbi:diguanylate cyclase (GGDEF)-like protein/PAS domain S-box-containing protein [Sphingomonas vulcanisoli]|uniref:diguanylate cyclase n=1 Tax=Sphingomonas vulcanisoli TaxID=1658060 RepID=A0ABX0TUC7_9SPHN|nr:diguanylate cyclase [Sphingomonas vulcanisoli]NIJ07375.1 diguanylate cyclase (GGDEF)-like protein/PAS domain S-box-containing protein [Sphingomonas vulcanisoli]
MIFFLVASLSELLPHQQGLTALWLPNAILLACLLHAPRPDQRLPLIVGALAGGCVSLVVRGMPPIIWLAFPIANVLESTIGAMLIWRMGGLLSTFERFDDVVRMVIAALVAPILPAVIAMVALNMSLGGGWFRSFYAWYGAGVVSLMLITPATLAVFPLCEDPAARRRIAREAVDLSGLIAGIAGLTALVFFAAKIPSMFLLMPVVMYAAFRQRQIGAIAGVLTMALVAIEATLHGYGPIAHAPLNSPELRMVILQLDLVAAFLVALPVASALTERDARAAEAQILADQFRAVVENVGEVIFRTDSGGHWTYLNPAWLAVSGHETANSLGMSWLRHIDPQDHVELEQWARPVLTGEVESSRRLIRFQTAHRGWRWMEVTMQTLFNNNGQVLGATGTLRDIDDRKRLEEHVLSAKRHAEQRAAEAVMLAATDELTGLANRRAFLRHLTRQIEAAGDLGQTFALAIFDVDHFKAVNDAYGHAVGDRVLQRVAARAMGVVRSGDLVGRIGGEEFGILMPGASPEDAALVAERLCRTIESFEMPLEDALPTVTVSVGVAALTGERDGGVLMARADAALYAAKADGRNRIRLAA